MMVKIFPRHPPQQQQLLSFCACFGLAIPSLFTRFQASLIHLDSPLVALDIGIMAGSHAYFVLAVTRLTLRAAGTLNRRRNTRVVFLLLLALAGDCCTTVLNRLLVIFFAHNGLFILI